VAFGRLQVLLPTDKSLESLAAQILVPHFLFGQMIEVLVLALSGCGLGLA
jgi:hypothetical protein